jgi:hypothetical protein
VWGIQSVELQGTPRRLRPAVPHGCVVNGWMVPFFSISFAPKFSISAIYYPLRSYNAESLLRRLWQGGGHQSQGM